MELPWYTNYNNTMVNKAYLGLLPKAYCLFTQISEQLYT